METLETRQKIEPQTRMVDTFNPVSTPKPKVETKWKQAETKRREMSHDDKKTKTRAD